MNCSLRSVNCHLSNMPHMCGLLPGPHTPGSRSLQLDEYRQAAWLAAHCTVWPRSNSEWNLLCWLPTIFSLAHKTIHTDMIRQDLQSLSSRLDRTLRYNNMFYFTIHIFENPTNRIDTAIHSFVSSFIHLKLVLDLRLIFFFQHQHTAYYTTWTFEQHCIRVKRQEAPGFLSVSLLALLLQLPTAAWWMVINRVWLLQRSTHQQACTPCLTCAMESTICR